MCLQFNDMLGESYGQIQAGDYLESIVACESEDVDLGIGFGNFRLIMLEAVLFIS